MAEAETQDNEYASIAEKEVPLREIADLAQISHRFGEHLPVETWHPPFCGDIDMRIAKDGSWYYQGSLIQRPALVRLFSRLLRKDGDKFVLVTPVECVGIQVEDAPFIAIELESAPAAAGDVLRFRTNVGDELMLDAEHPLRFETGVADGVIPYVRVRGGLWARLTRALTLELIGLATTQEIDGRPMFGIASAEAFFPIAPAADFE